MLEGGASGPGLGAFSMLRNRARPSSMKVACRGELRVEAELAADVGLIGACGGAGPSGSRVWGH